MRAHADVDVGGEVLRRVEQRLVAAGVAATALGRGLAWQPGGVSQAIWAEPAFSAEGGAARFTVRSECGPGDAAAADRLRSLLADPTAAGLSAVVQASTGSRRLQLVSALRVERGDAQAAVELVVNLSRLQVWQARRLASDAQARHETVPGGASGPISWSAEMAECFARLSALPAARVLAVGGGLTARPAGPRAHAEKGGLLVVAPKYRCDRAGTGVLVTAAASWPGETRDALILNQSECADGAAADILGGWAVHRQELRYSSFCPDWAYVPGLAARLACAAAARLGWGGSGAEARLPEPVTSSRSSGTRGWSARPCAPLPWRG